ncbi:hypothetical protein GNI_020960 [Gregarina niphandrodes]|uniref:Uncharacterized protein n=1 Tax=Gregarina niphandrodes TaxID=110365 RepID=A0A023BC01_GRENI|nr:hypothetical protein GNI_020960 [Gregarina niphandrodes]EZG80632.1 hypothetical protein GNI_020960 [Gregarina niphandrodes]|eukprot:XP_011134288.1 hypothetical protein GNI_020960 [Gregarina niphandrodes]
MKFFSCVPRRPASENAVLTPVVLAGFVVPVTFNNHLLDLCSVDKWLSRPTSRMYASEYNVWNGADMWVISALGDELNCVYPQYRVILGGQCSEIPNDFNSHDDDDDNYPSWQDDFIKLLCKSEKLQSCLATVLMDLAKRAERMVTHYIKCRYFGDILEIVNDNRYNDSHVKCDCAQEIAFNRWPERSADFTELAASYKCLHTVEEDGATVCVPASHLTCRPSKVLENVVKCTKKMVGLID